MVVRLLALALLASLAACSSEQDVERDHERFLRAVYAMVARHPNDGAALDEWFDESDYYDTALDRAIGELVLLGRVRVTDEGIVAVPPDQWPPEQKAKALGALR